MPKTSSDASAAAADKKKKKTKKAPEKGYGTYIHRVHKKLHDKASGISVSAKAIEVVNAVIEDLERRLSNRAFDLCSLERKSTLSAKHIQTATKLVLPIELSGCAMRAGLEATSNFSAA